MDDFSERASLSRWTYENKFTLRSMTSFSSLEHLNSNNSPFRFNAKELDEETGNYYYGARYYDPKFSIWISVDPLAEQMPEWSSYAYTFNNPVNYVDPTGMVGEEVNGPTTDIWKLFKKDDGTYRAEKQHINDGKDDQIYLVMGDDGVATAMYDGVEAENNMNKDGIAISERDNGNTTMSVTKDAFFTFFTSNDYRIKSARETMFNYFTSFIGGGAGTSANAGKLLLNAGYKGFFARATLDALVQYGITGDVDLIGATASGVGFGRYGHLARFVGANFDYSIRKNSFDRTFSDSKPLNHMLYDLGASYAPGLGKNMASPGNYLGPNGVKFTGNAFGILGSELLKNQ
ncbi:MAG: RHS repeat-associated core domain-containing protein [Bacteroidota bacterium]